MHENIGWVLMYFTWDFTYKKLNGDVFLHAVSRKHWVNVDAFFTWDILYKNSMHEHIGWMLMFFTWDLMFKHWMKVAVFYMGSHLKTACVWTSNECFLHEISCKKQHAWQLWMNVDVCVYMRSLVKTACMRTFEECWCFVLHMRSHVKHWMNVDVFFVSLHEISCQKQHAWTSWMNVDVPCAWNIMYKTLDECFCFYMRYHVTNNMHENIGWTLMFFTWDLMAKRMHASIWWMLIFFNLIYHVKKTSTFINCVLNDIASKTHQHSSRVLMHAVFHMRFHVSQHQHSFFHMTSHVKTSTFIQYFLHENPC